MKALKASKNGSPLEIWGNGEQGRAFVHALDVVDAIIASFKLGANKGVIQIGPDVCTSINKLSKIIIAKLDKDSKINYDLDKPVGDIEDAKIF